MKRSTYILIIVLLFTGQLFYSCKKALKQPPLGSLSEELVANKNGVNGLLIGAYAALDGMQGGDVALGGGDAWQASPTNWVFGSVVGVMHLKEVMEQINRLLIQLPIFIQEQLMPFMMGNGKHCMKV
ncbi:hypothetical protein [Pedobacter steynii]